MNRKRKDVAFHDEFIPNNIEECFYRCHEKKFRHAFIINKYYKQNKLEFNQKFTYLINLGFVRVLITLLGK